MKSSRFTILFAVASIALLSSCAGITVKGKDSSSTLEESSVIETSSNGENSIKEGDSAEFSAVESDEDGSAPSISEDSAIDESSSDYSLEEESLDSSTDIVEESSSESSPIDSSISEIEEEGYEIIETPRLRMPGEFEPASFVKMCYPNNMPLSAYKTIAEDNEVLLLVNPSSRGRSRIEEARSALSSAGANLENITFLDMDIGDDYGYWVRDFSPFYVFDGNSLSITDFTYNRPSRVEQNAVAGKLADYFGFPYRSMDLIHTGGNLMQDGRGHAFSDDLVLTENNDNKSKVLLEMEEKTGTSEYTITIDPQGDYIAHIDCWAKIIAPDKIVVAKLPASNPRCNYYEQVAKELGELNCCYGYPYKIYRLEEPGGNTLAPYTNSLIANNHVYMPLGSLSSYNKKAIEVYEEALPGYEVIGVEGFSSGDNAFLNTDALHCRTHEVPDKDMVYIDSRDVYHDEVDYRDAYLIKANVIGYGESEIEDESVKIVYSINGSAYKATSMERYQDSDNFTFAFSSLKQGDEVSYYIEATSERNGKKAVDPSCGQDDPHHFQIKSK